ncbi:GNAT family N-acetyltransferase [Vibrio ostreicida]|uniref:GNAT family N-acetyltransferase n=1 Tax=Vibrio ostreicida TaxID=526588 RepID=A0ABT8BWY0_9VIBR|nr:GNAT family N-acetyltransferase [Vibrio ostreicida]MDN3611702.1 GNAT family N-acetyltransferase [Vibrio ostreicida]NPD10103.1 GNAT family N-acetyltransferase [Vibrio ostreicida]
MEFKVAEYSDYERIAALHTQSWKTFYHGLLSEDYLRDEISDERLAIWQTRLINPPFNQHVLLLDEGGLLCGFVCAFGNHDFEKGTMIDALHVDESFRGRGLGVKLMAEVAKWIKQYFPENAVYLEVIKDNVQAVKFYEHIGGTCEQERLWKAPCGSHVPLLIFHWRSVNELLQCIGQHTSAEVVP